MLERGGEGDLATESLDAHGGRHLGPQHLERDRAAVADVACEVHGCHAARPDLPLDQISIGEARLQEARIVDHGPNLALTVVWCQPGDGNRWRHGCPARPLLTFRSSGRPAEMCVAT